MTAPESGTPDLRERLTALLDKYECTNCGLPIKNWTAAGGWMHEDERHWWQRCFDAPNAVATPAPFDPSVILEALGAKKVQCNLCEGRGEISTGYPVCEVDECPDCAGSGSLYSIPRSAQ